MNSHAFCYQCNSDASHPLGPNCSVSWLDLERRRTCHRRHAAFGEWWGCTKQQNRTKAHKRPKSSRLQSLTSLGSRLV